MDMDLLIWALRFASQSPTHFLLSVLAMAALVVFAAISLGWLVGLIADVAVSIENTLLPRK